ncbi:hypothetical protein [Tessaracoccus antarcticus]|uniref:Uncharacterized protein n=1 Tax=Tessaracoccus antarcticus TaxID=2479848 RepID=A0A3M0GAI3_9ACTN|nr:hypothetical protein [Tessaracoccus antarcticus]RMB61307.1 hypothetical protein EAX62_01165 [Tessaracoccus antarcticus]
MATPAPGVESGTQEELRAIESARQAAVDSTPRPEWLNVLFALTVGVAFGFAVLRTPTGWTVGAVVFVVGLVGFLVIDTHLKRRTGGLLNVSGRNALRFFLMYAIIFVLGQIQPPISWQPWFAIAAGLSVAIAGYIYLRWDAADTAKKLATGDFESSDLMP